VADNPERLVVPLRLYSKTIGGNRWRVSRFNRIDAGAALIQGTDVDISGRGNEVAIGHMSRLIDCHIYVCGSNNRIEIGERVSLKNTELWIEDDNNHIVIGDHTSIAGTTHLAAIEGTRIDVGGDCLFSSDIRMATGDGHSVIDNEGKRINPSRDILIGNHVWVGNRVACLKGVQVADNCVVGTGSILGARFDESNAIIVGSPGHVIRTGVSWLHERI
jgi:acetyltransferase-like isoleucine patch superfamily enzyme